MSISAYLFLLLQYTNYNNYIYDEICGARSSQMLRPFHLKPKTHAEEEEVSEDEMKGIQTAKMYYR